MSKKLYAVLTGDVVRSSKLTSAELDRLFEALAEAVREAGGWDASLEHTQFYRYRGDGWQLVLREPRWALRLCLFLRASLKAADPQFATRIAVGIGGVDHLDETNLAASSGEAFELSGQLLEGMSSSRTLAVALGSGAPTKIALLTSVFVLCDTISQSWSHLQAVVLRYGLKPEAPHQSAIAKLLEPPITQSAVAQRLSGGNSEALIQAITHSEALLARSAPPPKRETR